MKNLRKHILSLIAVSATTASLLGCTDDTVLLDPEGGSPNSGTVSQAQFFLGFDPVSPSVVDLDTGSVDLSVEMTVTAHVGDRNNQVLTDAHTVYFEAEWGLIEPFCITVNGECSVTWQPSGQFFPADLETTIVAYTIGEEAFDDANGNGTFDDGETFYDVEEPFIDRFFTEFPPVFDASQDIVIDVVNGNDLTGANLVHDIGDGFFNGGGCTHSSLCSTVLTSITIWDWASIKITGDAVITFELGGTVTGLTGTVELDNGNVTNNEVLSVTTDGAFVFTTELEDGETYNVAVATQPAGQVCTVANGVGTINALLGDVTNIDVTCVTIPTFTVGGNVTGIPATESVVLQNNGGDDLTLTADGAFVFLTPVQQNATYSVTVLTQPASATCTVTNGSGTITANVTNVTVTCM